MSHRRCDSARGSRPGRARARRRLGDGRRATAAGVLATALLAFACARPVDPVAGGSDDVVFLVQTVVPVAVMEALFRGRVALDDAGCLRLDAPEPATVVWPKGFRLAEDGAGLRVLDATGQPLGMVGGRFALGGGEVAGLWEGLGIPEAERRRAAARCPGRYWIVGDVVRD